MADQKPYIQDVSGLHKKSQPIPPAEMAQLNWLTGTWIIEANYYAEGRLVATRPQEYTFSWMYGGMYLSSTVRAHGPLAYWEAHQTISWDAQRQIYVGAMFDRFGSVLHTEGRLVEPQNFTFHLSRPFVFMDPNVKAVRAKYWLTSDEQFHFALEPDDGQGFHTLIEGAGERQY